jgi:hypothetical protein
MNYSGIDLHSNNSAVTVIDETDRVVAEKRLPNDLLKILAFFAAWQTELTPRSSSSSSMLRRLRLKRIYQRTALLMMIAGNR